jgi:hypothetical protein
MLFADIEYWRSLWSGDVFRGQSLASCIKVIHADIVGVWNLPNKDNVCLFPGAVWPCFTKEYQYLSRKEFREEISYLVQDLGGYPITTSR